LNTDLEFKIKESERRYEIDNKTEEGTSRSLIKPIPIFNQSSDRYSDVNPVSNRDHYFSFRIEKDAAAKKDYMPQPPTEETFQNFENNNKS